jgi:nitric oxide dioxygenase
VAAFAGALVNMPGHLPEVLLARVAHKHASLGIQPDQYQVVHDSLMWAIADVLGDAVTPEVAAAWDEVYWLMADALVHIERGLCSARGKAADRVAPVGGRAEDPGDRRRGDLCGQAHR